MRIFLDAADPDIIERWADRVDGFTTNPTLMRQAGIKSYRTFAQALAESTKKPVSLEVLADDAEEILRQARILAGFGDNVLVKIPVMRTDGADNASVIALLAEEGVRLNVTAITSPKQIVPLLGIAGRQLFSVFAGRIADSGRDPSPLLEKCARLTQDKHYLLWASAREVLNVRQAEAAGCHVITLTAPLLEKISGFGRGLDEISLATVRQFFEDGEGFSL